VRLANLTENVVLVDLGRVEILFFKGVPVAVKDWGHKVLFVVRMKKGTEAGDQIEKFYGTSKLTRERVVRHELEKKIVLAYADHATPMVGHPGHLAPRGRK